jgi:hypothetical protein
MIRMLVPARAVNSSAMPRSQNPSTSPSTLGSVSPYGTIRFQNATRSINAAGTSPTKSQRA